ncbi:hypothetical protein QA597_03500 [Marinilabiliaceae bacterium ANBcel2]|nr:hypothetical protein [Marinilabiliaceae bacterium ANBcel2]
MVKVLIKEFIFAVVAFGVGVKFILLMDDDVFLKWGVFCTLLFALFAIGTLLCNHLKISRPEWTAPGLAIITLAHQLILLLILFIFLEPENENHRIVVKKGLGAYLFFLALDTYWKIMWLFPRKKR